MQGEVYVYSPIGGMNMDAGIATADMTGSNMESGEESSLHVAWELPGGIVNTPHGHPEAAWGYLFSVGNEISDKDIYEYLVEQNMAEMVDDTTYNITNEPAARDIINGFLNAYVSRIMDYTIKNPTADETDPLSLPSFLFHFIGCVSSV